MKFLASFLVVVVLSVAAPVYGTINVDIYSDYVDNGSEIDFLGSPADSFTSSNIHFASDTDNNWHPIDQLSFAAKITGYLSTDSEGTVDFTLASDFRSLLFIDGSFIISSESIQNPVFPSVFLTKGLHPFEIQFYEDGNGQSGVDLNFTGEGVSYADAVPEPTAIIVWSLLGLLGIFYGWRKRKSL
jgi:hypothetical protein